VTIYRKYRKPFSQELYDKFDGPMKKALSEYLIKNGHSIVSDKEDYGVDIISEKDGKLFYSEGEVNINWYSTKWPGRNKDIRIPERKIKLLETHDNIDFYIFNKNLDSFCRINSIFLTKESIRTVESRNITMGEQFFHIPYEKAEFLYIGEDDFV